MINIRKEENIAEDNKFNFKHFEKVVVYGASGKSVN
jgi:hypothetical protein